MGKTTGLFWLFFHSAAAAGTPAASQIDVQHVAFCPADAAAVRIMPFVFENRTAYHGPVAELKPRAHGIRIKIHSLKFLFQYFASHASAAFGGAVSQRHSGNQFFLPAHTAARKKRSVPDLDRLARHRPVTEL